MSRGGGGVIRGVEEVEVEVEDVEEVVVVVYV